MNHHKQFILCSSPAVVSILSLTWWNTNQVASGTNVLHHSVAVQTSALWTHERMKDQLLIRLVSMRRSQLTDRRRYDPSHLRPDAAAFSNNPMAHESSIITTSWCLYRVPDIDLEVTGFKRTVVLKDWAITLYIVWRSWLKEPRAQADTGGSRAGQVELEAGGMGGGWRGWRRRRWRRGEALWSLAAVSAEGERQRNSKDDRKQGVHAQFPTRAGRDGWKEKRHWEEESQVDWVRQSWRERGW